MVRVADIVLNPLMITRSIAGSRLVVCTTNRDARKRRDLSIVNSTAFALDLSN